jgi:hypothetical protein
MEPTMKGEKIPETDSIEELARFWDSHDLRDVEDQLEEVSEPVFQGEPGVRLSIRLNSKELERLRRLASERGIEEVVLIRNGFSNGSTSRDRGRSPRGRLSTRPIPRVKRRGM